MRGKITDKVLSILTLTCFSYIVIRVFIPFLMEVFSNGAH